MPRIYYCLLVPILLVAFFSCSSAQKPTSVSDLIASGAVVQKLADGFGFTEGPAADADGNVFFTDQPNNKIWKWGVDSALTVFHDSPERANGMFFDLNGNLLACADQYFRLVSFNKQGQMTVLVDNFEGKRLNGPNDLWVHANGGIYFTDPYYQRPWWERTAPEIDGQCVYYLKPDRKSVIRVIDDFVQPNGIIGAPDGKTLYVADIAAGKTWSYTINDEGTLTNKKLFAPEGSDGMTIDCLGNVYLTNRAVSVFAPDGVKLGVIGVPEIPANVCFGGIDKNTLFITARTGLYSITMQVSGL